MFEPQGTELLAPPAQLHDKALAKYLNLMINQTFFFAPIVWDGEFKMSDNLNEDSVDSHALPSGHGVLCMGQGFGVFCICTVEDDV